MLELKVEYCSELGSRESGRGLEESEDIRRWGGLFGTAIQERDSQQDILPCR